MNETEEVLVLLCSRNIFGKPRLSFLKEFKKLPSRESLRLFAAGFGVQAFTSEGFSQEDAIKIAKALCKACGYINKYVCPTVEKL